jgi:predicted DNA binding protein
VVLADGQRIYDVYGIEEEAKAIDEAVTGNHGIVPLYRLPALTDAEREAMDPVDFGGLTDKEREAIEAAIRRELDAEWYGGKEPDRVVALRGLLERTK